MAQSPFSKKDYLPPLAESQTSRRASAFPKRDAILVVAAVALTSLLHLAWQFEPLWTSPEVLHGPAKEFSWEDIQPSPSLEYHSCFDGFQCARLEVPLDWNATVEENDLKVALAIIKLPSRVNVTDPRYGGPILFNPGGPGGSGVNLLLRIGNPLRILLDSGEDLPGLHNADPEKYYDLISWDPRFISNTFIAGSTLDFGCIKDPYARQAWLNEDSALGSYLDDAEIFSKVWSRKNFYSASCVRNAYISTSGTSEVTDKDINLAEFVSTANVIRDMVEIIERHGEWRENEAKTLLTNSVYRGQDVESVLERTAWKKDEEKLQYWGFSYGTVVGQTFASMQPHRVERIVVDGVVDVDDYYAGGWTTNLVDIDEITRNFTVECYQAGPLNCALYDTLGPEKIEETFYRTLEDLRAYPLTIGHEGKPVSITHSDVILEVFNFWYGPLVGFGEVAKFMKGLSERNGTSFAEFLVNFRQPVPTCQLPSLLTRDMSTAQTAILCTDGDSHVGQTQADFKEYVSLLKNQSSLFGDRWSLVILSCFAFDVRAKWRWSGPVGADTAYPILFASQSLDPVTPLRNAIKYQKLFPGSAVVESEGMGHCTLAQPSLGVIKAIRKYFHAGEMPENGAKFPVMEHPFSMPSVLPDDLSLKDVEIMNAAREIAEIWPWGLK